MTPDMIPRCDWLIMGLTKPVAEIQLERVRLFAIGQESGQASSSMSAGAAPGRTLRPRPNTLSFHFDRLRNAGPVAVRREGRSLIYSARFETMHALVNYLTENCCTGVAARRGAPKRAASMSKSRINEKA
jgi:ArsR family transcriptional regulator